MNTTEIFQPFPKMARYSRQAIVTEKIDGTNASVIILDRDECPLGSEPLASVEVNGIGHYLFAGSRTRIITPANDNYGFASWVKTHAEELAQLGFGRHFGEWWGSKIQRAYGLTNGDRRFSLFNVNRWCLYGDDAVKSMPDGSVVPKEQLPPCCGLVPIIATGIFGDDLIESAMFTLRDRGSLAMPGYRNPEGIVVFHVAAQTLFKKLIENDELPKGAVGQ